MLDKLETTLHRWATAFVNGLRKCRDYCGRLKQELKDVWDALKG